MKKRGRPFEPGNKYGRGRPRGSRNKKSLRAQALLDSQAGSLISKAMKMALQGDGPMLRTLHGYVLSRHRDQPLHMGPLPMGTTEQLSQTSDAILKGVAAGKVSSQQARDLFNLIETRRRLIETVELEARLQTVEQQQAPAEPQGGEHPPIPEIEGASQSNSAG